ncbi:MAG: UDP-glucose/GDP-mannose dehydrogenase family protein [Candidatus Euphemobacter frigidus]|nr:UDP-glucose/GDP-mannose dehydrogenase family protein [Candidatus Euphemobacter frigidus]MDP8275650.1 UDP-glucose/GDP-mannose dehydrogenase family protein [Candidatus Euphemobacter frigidus]
MKVCIIGAGYVGLVTGATLAELGNRVICVDNNEEKIAILNRDEIPIYEPGLKEMVRGARQAGRMSFITSIAEGVKASDIIFIAVSTPPKADGSADLSAVAAVAREVAENLNGYKVVVDKSTVPVKTGEKVAETIKRYSKGNGEFDVVSNPEFLREGSAIYDTFHPDRIIIGTSSRKAADLLIELYKPLNAPVIVTDINSAEIIKHAANSFLATKISFANALAHICEASGANVEEVTRGVGLDSRVGSRFLNAGVGYGGSCFPKDVSAFIAIAEELRYDFGLLKEVERINKTQVDYFFNKIKETLWILEDKIIGVLGLAFKPDTDDMRNAPSVKIISRLLEEGARVKAFDPRSMEKAREILPDIEYCDGPYQVAEGAEALVIVTEWNEFREMDLKRIKELLHQPIILDGRNIYDPAKMEKLGFIYKSVGR